MGTVTAKELKQKTGEMIRRVKSGERLTITLRGKTVAVLAPPEVDQAEEFPRRPPDEAWDDIEKTLERTKPEFPGWKEATDWARNRT
jgi:prevent-host-death family protein